MFLIFVTFLLFFWFVLILLVIEGDSKSGSIIYPPRVVPKVEPNTQNDLQSRNIWGQPSSSSSSVVPQQRLPHQAHCKIYDLVFVFILSLFIIFLI